MQLQLLRTAAIAFSMFVSVVAAVAQAPTYTTPGGSSNNNFPFNNSGTNKVQWVYTPAEFTPSLQAGMITHVYFRSNNTSSTSKSFADYRVSIGYAGFSTFPNGTYVTGLTVCYGPTTSNISFNGNGWFGVQLTTPFPYDGVSNIVIEATITNTNGTTVNQNTTNGNKRIWGGRTATSGSTGSGQAACGLEIVTCSTAISQQPMPSTICEDEQTTFSIATVDATVFKWQVDEGSGFVDVVNGPNYSGAASKTLTVNQPPATYDGYRYRALIAKGSSTSCVDTSDTVMLNVNGLVQAEPLKTNDTTCINANKDIQLKATGAVTGYRWQIYNTITQQFEDLMMQPPYIITDDLLQITSVSDTLDGARFRVLVDGICDTYATNETRLTVLAIPKVGVHPVDVTTDPGNKATYEVQATAAAALYQWQVSPGTGVFSNINDGGIYQGTRTNRLTVLGVDRSQNEFQFRCVVRTSSGCNAPGDTSNVALLYVNPLVTVGGPGKDIGLVVYPNPAEGRLHIKTGSSANEKLKYRILDKTGRTLIIGNLNGGTGTLDITRLPANIYLLEILNNTGQMMATSRFTKL